jgi:DNA polymerase III alpha subunit
MHVDQLGIPIYSKKDVLDIIYQDQSAILENITVDVSLEDLIQFNNASKENGGPKLTKYEPLDIDVQEFDQLLQHQWLMPDEYKTYDIIDWLYCQCETVEQKTRVTEELTAFAERDMIMLLKWLKYFVDTCRTEHIVWGVGRGSSVASYVLYVIGVHKINSIKYNLDWREFLR